MVTPEADHLAELARPLGLIAVDASKDERLERSPGPHFAPGGCQRYRAAMLLSRPDVTAAVAMGPSAWHTDPAVLASRIAALPDPLPVTAAVALRVYRPSPGSGQYRRTPDGTGHRG